MTFENSESRPLLEISNLKLNVNGDESVSIVDDISLFVSEGQMVGLVGESGSGKSMTAFSISRLLPDGINVSGKVFLKGEELTKLSRSDLENLRGSRISYIFQEPMSALNPSMTVGRQILDVVVRHTEYRGVQARERVLSLLREMRIPAPESVYNQRPFELSGGMRQRILIAMAFSCDPELIIADEPTTALDVTVQAKILNLLQWRAKQSGVSILLITHDLAVVRQVCDYLYVMYKGQIVEHGPAGEVMNCPRHPYTAGLIACLPSDASVEERLMALPPVDEEAGAAGNGCIYRERCLYASEPCGRRPVFEEVEHGGAVACWNHRVAGSVNAVGSV